MAVLTVAVEPARGPEEAVLRAPRAAPGPGRGPWPGPGGAPGALPEAAAHQRDRGRPT